MAESATIIAVIVGLVEVCKRAGVSSKYLPLLSLAFGVSFGFLFGEVGATSAFQGVVLGLTAVGLFSGVRATLK